MTRHEIKTEEMDQSSCFDLSKLNTTEIFLSESDHQTKEVRSSKKMQKLNRKKRRPLPGW